MRRYLCMALFAAVLVLGSCSSADDDDSSTSDTAAPQADDSASPGGLDPSLRLIADLEPVTIDLAGNVQSPEIAAVLDFKSGAGGIPPCDNYFAELDDTGALADGVALVVESLDPPAIGVPAFLCLRGWTDAVDVTLRLPDGTEVAAPVDAPGSTYGPGVELARPEAFNEGEVEIQIATFPGAQAGEYQAEMVDGSRRETVSFAVEPALDLGATPRVFTFERYYDWFGESGNLVSGDETYVGFVGFDPGVPVDLFLFRSADIAESEYPPTGDYELAGDVSVVPDDRGEAVVAIELDTDEDGHCYRFDTHQDILDELEAGPFVVGNDPTVFCVDA